MNKIFITRIERWIGASDDLVDILNHRYGGKFVIVPDSSLVFSNDSLYWHKPENLTHDAVTRVYDFTSGFVAGYRKGKA